jgi:serine/threonine protein kinase
VPAPHSSPQPDVPAPEQEALASVAEAATPAPVAPPVVFPTAGETIISEMTGCTYTIGPPIGQGSFGVVYACVDDWNNELAAKVLKPTKPPQEIQAAALAEMNKLLRLRHPQITYFFDAFEYRNTCYIITERCEASVAELLASDWFEGPVWTLAIARSLLQAVQFLHLNGYAHQDIHAANVFALRARNELNPEETNATQFRLADLGVAKLFSEIRPENTRDSMDASTRGAKPIGVWGPRPACRHLPLRTVAPAAGAFEGTPIHQGRDSRGQTQADGTGAEIPV